MTSCLRRQLVRVVARGLPGAWGKVSASRGTGAVSLTPGNPWGLGRVMKVSASRGKRAASLTPCWCWKHGWRRGAQLE